MIVFIAAIIPILLLTWRRSHSKKYPPGPKRLPIIGNLFDIPTRHAHDKLAQYSKDLGSDIIHLDAVGTHFIILNSIEACNDLLDKRSSKYSSRHTPTMVYKMVNGNRIIATLPYGNEWREARRITIKYISAPNQAGPISDVITAFAYKSLLPNLLLTPEDFRVHVRNGVGGSILHLIYGLRIKKVNDPWIVLADEGLRAFMTAAVPGKHAVDVFPVLQYIPDWFPGAHFKKRAKEWRTTLARFIEEPFNAAKQDIINGTAQASFVSQSLEDIADKDDKERLEGVIQNIGGTISAGGLDTSVTAVLSLIAALLLFPDVQARVQAEMDSVIGNGRLPVLEDKPRLPYLHAVLKEVLRWRPIAPLGLPHMTTEEDVYRGYIIPKDAIVIANTWAMMHNEGTFPKPAKFDPSRFLTPSGQLRVDKSILDPEVEGTFGFGRRVCPGSSFALASFWLGAACIIACFNITPEVDEKGQPIPSKIEYLGNELTLHPEPFKCRITPRSNQVIALIQQEYDETSEYIL